MLLVPISKITDDASFMGSQDKPFTHHLGKVLVYVSPWPKRFFFFISSQAHIPLSTPIKHLFIGIILKGHSVWFTIVYNSQVFHFRFLISITPALEQEGHSRKKNEEVWILICYFFTHTEHPKLNQCPEMKANT